MILQVAPGNPRNSSSEVVSWPKNWFASTNFSEIQKIQSISELVSFQNSDQIIIFHQPRVPWNKVVWGPDAIWTEIWILVPRINWILRKSVQKNTSAVPKPSSWHVIYTTYMLYVYIYICVYVYNINIYFCIPSMKSWFKTGSQHHDLKLRKNVPISHYNNP